MFGNTATVPELKVAFLDIAGQERRHGRTVARAIGKHAREQRD